MIDQHGRHSFEERHAALHAAEAEANALFDEIETAVLVQPGRTEREVEKDIYALAEERFGITAHWHKRLVRCGPNALCISSDNPPVQTIDEDDLVWVDLGPVFDDWEADIGRSYVIGNDPQKHALVRDLPIVFEKLQTHFKENLDVTGAELYRKACDEAEKLGWKFGGAIAGHIVSEFAHAHLPGNKDYNRISPLNDSRMRDPDALGQEKFWILEVHLVSPDGKFGGFYERLL
jgi:Xaa-Pro aminopeptidase